MCNNLILTHEICHEIFLCSSNNGKLIATVGSSGILRIWSYDSGSLISSHIGHSGTINSVCFSTDDRQIVTVGDDGCSFIWSIYDNM